MSDEIRYRSATPADLPAIADLFQQSFPEALDATFGKSRLPNAPVEDVFAILHGFEPNGIWVAEADGRVAGFIIGVSAMPALYRALLRPHALPRMILHWLTGRYRGIGFGFVPRLWKAWRDYRASDSREVQQNKLAQILSIAVDPVYQHHGIGSRLMGDLLKYLRTTGAQAVRLEVDAAKTGPIQLYRKFHFKETATIPSPRGPALVMMREWL